MCPLFGHRRGLFQRVAAFVCGETLRLESSSNLQANKSTDFGFGSLSMATQGTKFPLSVETETTQHLFPKQRAMPGFSSVPSVQEMLHKHPGSSCSDKQLLGLDLPNFFYFSCLCCSHCVIKPSMLVIIL